MTEQRILKLSEVRVDNALNPRQGALDQIAVLEYSQHIDDLPPMTAFAVPGEGYLLVAGFHRIAAHQLVGAAEGKFVVEEGSREEAAEFADLDNLKHGLQLNRAEKREVIRRELKRHPDWSDVRLAAACFTTDKTVRSVREELESNSEIPKVDVLVGADGIRRPRSVPRPAPAQPVSGQQVVQHLEMKKIEPDVMVTVIIKPTGAVLISLGQAWQPPKAFRSAERATLCAVLEALLLEHYVPVKPADDGDVPVAMPEWLT